MPLKLQKSIYNIETIRNTIYWFSDKYSILLTEDDLHFEINCANFNSEIENEFLKSLNDFSLRDQINRETKDIKDLVMSKAFYPELIKFKDIGEFDDPINIIAKDGN
jgi:His-Xaa-Ser system protein HxsD